MGARTWAHMGPHAPTKGKQTMKLRNHEMMAASAFQECKFYLLDVNLQAMIFYLHACITRNWFWRNTKIISLIAQQCEFQVTHSWLHFVDRVARSHTSTCHLVTARPPQASVSSTHCLQQAAVNFLGASKIHKTVPQHTWGSSCSLNNINMELGFNVLGFSAMCNHAHVPWHKEWKRKAYNFSTYCTQIKIQFSQQTGNMYTDQMIKVQVTLCPLNKPCPLMHNLKIYSVSWLNVEAYFEIETW